MLISIIIPTLNEEASIEGFLQQLQLYRQQGHEVIIVDGGSHDKTIFISSALADKVIVSESGRARQMNLGAKHAEHDVLWFLHADSIIHKNSIYLIQNALMNTDWGRFNVRLSGTHFLFRIIEKMMNIRSRIFAIATGDQGIFVKKTVFDSVGGYSNIPLMEDITLSKHLKKISRPMCVNSSLITSSRRWEEKGIISTVLLMWRLRFLYWLGVSADRLALQYK